MATKFTAGTVINAGLIVVGVDADAPPATPSPAPEPAPPANWVVVGAKRDDEKANNSGAVYVYDANNLSAQPTKLTAFDAANSDHFGIAVAVTDDKFVVGAYLDDDNAINTGSVYVYNANNLSAQPTKLTAFDSSWKDVFGYSVAATNDKVVVGAYGDSAYGDGDNTGAIYVYDANNLSAQPTKLMAFDGASSDHFGYSVAANADKIVVGAYNDDDNGSNSGSAYVFDANDLSAQPTKLTASDGDDFDYFGWSVAVTDDKIIVSAYLDDDDGPNSGSVYVYDANDLTAQPTKLTAFDGAANDHFGHSVAVASDKIIVGSPNDNSGSGSVYVYNANDLTTQPTKLTAFDGASSDHFGTAVAVMGDKIAVGAVYDDDNGGDSGSVYVYDVNDLSAQATKLTAFDGHSGAYFGSSVAVG